VRVGRRAHRLGSVCGALVALVATSCAAPSATRPVILHPKSPAPDVATPSTASTTSTTPVSSAGPTTSVSPLAPVPGWSAPLTTLPPGGGFTSVSCISDTFCIAAGGGANDADTLATAGSGVTVSWDGAAWSAPSVYFPAPGAGPPTAPLLPAIACTGGPLCVIVDGSDHVSSGDGTNWSPPSPLPVSAAILQGNPADPGAGRAGSRDAAVTCPDPTFCAAVDNTGHAASLVDGNWSDPSSFGTNGVALYEGGLVGITCATSSMCRAVVGTAVLDWDGGGWSQEPSPWTSSLPPGAPGAPEAAAIGCPTTTLCAIVSGTGLSVDEPGQPWTPPRTIDPEGGLDSISCPTATFCMAADEHGSVLQWNGGAWSAPAQVLPAATDYTGDPTSVSCPDDRFCIVVNGDGDYATYSGGGTRSSAGTG
jgi:hypothetical protein